MHQLLLWPLFTAAPTFYLSGGQSFSAPSWDPGQMLSLWTDRLKPVFSTDPVSVAVPRACGRPALRVPEPVLRTPGLLAPPSATVPVPVRPRKTVRFQLLTAAPTWRNPHGIRICSAVTPPFLLGGVLWRVDVRHSVPTADPHLYSTN